MIRLSTFFLFYYLYLLIGSIFAVDPSIIEENRNKYPWMVIIYRPIPLSASITYGTIIHERAVLTLASPEIELSQKFEFRVLADCFVNITHSFSDASKTMPEGLKKIKEFHQITTGLDKDLELLILEEPLKFNSKVNVIELLHKQNQFHPHNCILLSIFSDITIDGTTVNEVMFFISYAVHFNQTHLDVITSSSNPLVPLDGEGRVIEHNEDVFQRGIRFTGGPLYCQSLVSEKWVQIGVSNSVMKVQGSENPRLILEGSLIRIDNETLYNTLDKAAQTSDIYNFKLDENTIRY